MCECKKQRNALIIELVILQVKRASVLLTSNPFPHPLHGHTHVHIHTHCSGGNLGCVCALEAVACYCTCGLRVPPSFIFPLLFFLNFFQLVMDDGRADVFTLTLYICSHLLSTVFTFIPGVHDQQSGPGRLSSLQHAWQRKPESGLWLPPQSPFRLLPLSHSVIVVPLVNRRSHNEHLSQPADAPGMKEG